MLMSRVRESGGGNEEESKTEEFFHQSAKPRNRATYSGVASGKST